MSATNVIKNPKTVVIDGVTVTSVLEVSYDDRTGFEKDGSDNDTSFTFRKAKAKDGGGNVRFRDPAQMELVNNKDNVTMVVTGNAAAGSDRTYTFSNLSTGQGGGRLPWDTLAEHTLGFEFGAVVIT